MFRRTCQRMIGMGAWSLTEKQKGQSEKRGWKELFWKPETRDEKIKEYVPEVLEESLAAQRAVLAAETTNRDRIVEAGHKVLKEIENKAPIPSIYPALVDILKLYGTSERIVSQRALNYLLYPSSASFAGHVPHELVGGFQENFKQLIENVENNGTVIAATSPAASSSAATPALEGAAPAAATPRSESPEATYLVKCVTGMCLANVQIGDFGNAVACVDAVLPHAIEDGRRAGLLALKAGVLNKQKKFDAAVEASRLAIEANPSNVQGYLQGHFALRALKRDDEAIALLESGAASLPANEAIKARLEETKATAKLSLPVAPQSDRSDAAQIAQGGAAPPPKPEQVAA